MADLDSLLSKVKKNNTNSDLALIKKAYSFAEQLHSEEKRLSGDSLFDHLFNVANLVADIQLEDVAVATALLHESIRKGKQTEASLESAFGPTVSTWVCLLTQMSESQFVLKEGNLMSKNVSKVFLLLSKDIHVALIRLADRVDNVRTISSLPSAEQAWAARQAINFYAPIADIIGAYYFKRQLEDGGLAVLHPDIFQNIAGQLKMDHAEMENAIEEIKNRLLSGLAAENITPVEIYGRTKNIYSIWKKLQRYQKSGKISELLTKNIYDQMALRVITNTVDECYRVLGLVNKMFTTLPEEFDDYIAKPKANGYRSIHSVIKDQAGRVFEVQIRTEAMHRENEFGQAAHFHYKTQGSTQASAEESNWVKRLTDWSNANIEEIFAEKVSIFTPKNDIIELPLGATPVDFAFAVHGQLGNKCIGAKVDGKIVPLDYRLQSGQTVEILVNKNKTKPSPDWIRFVVTAKAKAGLKKAKY